MKTALLLIAHGSRRAEANQDLFELAEHLRAHGSFGLVEPAFLEAAAPSIADAGRRCVQQAASQVVLVPYFLSAGVHVRLDLETARAALQSAHPQSTFLLAEPLGPHSLLAELVVLRANEALAKKA